jgi:hypothetical protein
VNGVSARAVFMEFSNLHLNTQIVFGNAFGGIYLAKNLIIFASLSLNDVVVWEGRKVSCENKSVVGDAFALVINIAFHEGRSRL